MLLAEEFTQRQLLALQLPALLPLGAFEVHNHDLPLGTDGFIAQAIAYLIGEHAPALLLPGLNYTYAGVTANLAGTISVELPPFTAYLAATLTAILRAGFGPVVVISAHGGNNVACLAAMEQVFQARPAGLLYCNVFGTAYQDLIADVWGEVDLVLAENACLWAALEVLGRTGIAQPAAPVTPPPAKPQQWHRIGRAGQFPHTYVSPEQHIPIRAVPDSAAGRQFLALAAGRIAAALSDLQVYHDEQHQD